MESWIGGVKEFRFYLEGDRDESSGLKGFKFKDK